MSEVAAGDLLGRTGDIAAVVDRVRRADGGVGSLVLVSGEAGIGKTALCERVLADVVGGGRRTGWVGCWQSAAMPALRPWSVLLGQIAPAGEEILTRGTTRAADPVVARLAQADAVTRLLADAASEQPLVLVIDDLHWADAATIELLTHVATVIRGMRVVLLVTYRPEDAGPVTPLGTQLAQLRRHSHEFPLAPLDDTAVAKILARAIDDSCLAPEVVTGLVRMVRGNPLFATELARLVTADGIDLSTDPPAVPRSVQDLVVARLGLLSSQCAGLLEAAAVIGDEVPLSLLAELSGRPLDCTVTILEEAVARSFVRVRVLGTYEFTHPLLRAAVYGSVTTRRRVHLHARIGDSLEGLRARGLPVDPAVLAHHFGRAAPTGTAGKAVSYAVDAGRQAMRMAAYPTAASRFRQALTVADTDPSAGDRVAILLALAEAQAASGDSSTARQTFGAAADGARAAGRGRDLAAAALGRSGGTGIEVPIDDREQTALLTEALEHLDADDAVLRAWLAARLSVALTMTASLVRRATLAAEAVDLATRADDPEALAHALAARCDVIAGPADVDERQRSARRIVELARSRDNVAVELLGGRLLVEALLERGGLDEAELAVTAFGKTSDRLRDPRYAFYVPLWRGTLALARGDLPTYRRHRASLAPAVTAAATENAATLGGVQEVFAAADIDPERAPALFFSRLSGQVTTFAPAVAVATAFMRNLAGKPDEARTLIESVTLEVMRLERDSEWVPAIVQLADMAATLPREPLVAWAYRELAPFADVWCVEGIGAAVRGPAERALGLLAARLGEWDAARTHFDRALAACVRCGARGWTDRTERDAARAMAGRARRDPLPLPPRSAMLWQEGDVWLLGYAGRTARLKDSKGLRDLAWLLAHPGEQVAALDLMAEGRTVVISEAPGPALDDRARSVYRARLREIEGDLDAVDAAGDVTRSANLIAERDAIAAELAGAYGLGGHARRTGSSAERARTAVTGRIRGTIRRIGEAHPGLAKHLSGSVRTGTFCSYTPDPEVRWDVRSPRSRPGTDIV